MKIEILCRVRTIHGEKKDCLFTCRVPSDIKVVCISTAEEILVRRKTRIKEINKYRHERYKREINDEIYMFSVKSWSPIITSEALEFICANF